MTNTFRIAVISTIAVMTTVLMLATAQAQGSSIEMSEYERLIRDLRTARETANQNERTLIRKWANIKRLRDEHTNFLWRANRACNSAVSKEPCSDSYREVLERRDAQTPRERAERARIDRCIVQYEDWTSSGGRVGDLCQN